jgi:hypothetical protein
MSIANEIERLQQAKASIKRALECKGVTVPSATTIDGYAQLIGSIGLPQGYTAIEYIENTSNAYIDTLFYPTLNSKIQVRFMPITTNTVGFFGSRHDPLRFCCTTFSNGSKMAFAVTDGTWVNDTVNVTVNNIYDCIAENGSYSINGTQYNSVTLSSWGGMPSFKLAGVSSSGDIVETRARFYIFKAWENNVLTNIMIPCINSNNVVGMYDIIRQKFYSSENSDTFVAGPVIG